MRLTFLGAGDMFAIGQGHNSVLIEWAGTNLVIDFPETNFRALRALGHDLTSVKHIYITHLHEDHINGLQLLANYCRVFAQDRPTLYAHRSLHPQLWETLRYGLSPSSSGPKTLEDFFHVVAVDESFSIEGVTFRPVETRHVPGMISHGLLCAPYFYYSGDCAIDNEYLTSIQHSVGTIFHECHLQDVVLPSHTSLADITALPQQLRDRIVLMHYEDRYSDPAERHALEQQTGLRIAGPLSAYELA